MLQSQAVELAFLIEEHVKTTAILAAMDQARDCTLFAGAGEEAKLSMLTTQGMVQRPVPMMLVRDMFQRATLYKGVEDYLKDLDQRLRDDFGIIIEEEVAAPSPTQPPTRDPMARWLP